MPDSLLLPCSLVYLLSVCCSFVFVGRLVVRGPVDIFLFVYWAPGVIRCVQKLVHLLNDDSPSISLVDVYLLCVVSVT